MATIERYVLVDRDDTERGYEFASYDDAKSVAEEEGCAVIARIYEYSDSELVWTPDGSNVWPPKQEG